MNKNNKPISVLVTGVSGGSIGEQICKTLHMGNHLYKLVVTNTSIDATKVITADKVELLPLASNDEYMDSLLELIKRFEIQFLIPGSEPELITIAKNLEVFSAFPTKVLINSPQVISTCVDKKLTFDFLSSNGFCIPNTLMLDNVEDIYQYTFSFPSIVKPALGGGGSAATFIAQDQDELHFFVKYLLKYGYHPLVQEYTPDAENEYTVGVLNSPHGNLLGTIVLRRQILSGLSNRLRITNHTARPEMGIILAISSGISQGDIVEFEPVKETAEKIAKCFGSVGPLNIQGRWDGSRFVPFEINPRFSGTTPMRALAGFNEPELMIDSYLGINQDQDLYRAQLGKCIRGLKEYFIPLNGGDISSSG